MNEQLSFLELLKFLNEIMRKIERNSLLSVCYSARASSCHAAASSSVAARRLRVASSMTRSCLRGQRKQELANAVTSPSST
jgi:hypothetical protein